MLPALFAWFFCRQTQRRVFCGWTGHALVTPSADPPHRPLCLWRWWWQGHRGTPCPRRCCSPQPGGGSWPIFSYHDTEMWPQVNKQMHQHWSSRSHAACVMSDNHHMLSEYQAEREENINLLWSLNAFSSNLKLIESGQDVLIPSIKLLRLTYSAAASNIMDYLYNIYSCDALFSWKAY